MRIELGDTRLPDANAVKPMLDYKRSDAWAVQASSCMEIVLTPR